MSSSRTGFFIFWDRGVKKYFLRNRCGRHIPFVTCSLVSLGYRKHRFACDQLSTSSMDAAINSRLTVLGMARRITPYTRRTTYANNKSINTFLCLAQTTKNPNSRRSRDLGRYGSCIVNTRIDACFETQPDANVPRSIRSGTYYKRSPTP